MCLPWRCFRYASAIGERTAFKVQAKRTLCGRSKGSAADVQHAEQREQAARRVVVDLDAPLELGLQQARALVVEAAPAHVDRLDARGRRALDRLVIALADLEIVPDEAAEG